MVLLSNLELKYFSIYKLWKLQKSLYLRVKKLEKHFKNEWWFSVLDVLAVLTDSPQPKTYWAKMKDRDKEMSQPFPFWEQ